MKTITFAAATLFMFQHYGIAEKAFERRLELN